MMVENKSRDEDISLTAIFLDNPDKPVPECFRSGFHWS